MLQQCIIVQTTGAIFQNKPFSVQFYLTFDLPRSFKGVFTPPCLIKNGTALSIGADNIKSSLDRVSFVFILTVIHVTIGFIIHTLS